MKARINQRRPTTANVGQRRLATANAGPQKPRKPTKVNAGQGGPTTANRDSQQPTQANEANESQRRPRPRPKFIGFFFFFSIVFVYQLNVDPKQPTQAGNSQCRPTKPTKANAGLAASAKANVTRYFFPFTQSSLFTNLCYY